MLRMLLLLLLLLGDSDVRSDEDVEPVFGHHEIRSHLLLKSISATPSLTDAGAFYGDALLHLFDT